MTTDLLPRLRPADLNPAHLPPADRSPARPFDLARLNDLVDSVLFYGILGLGVLVPIVFAVYGLLFR